MNKFQICLEKYKQDFDKTNGNIKLLSSDYSYYVRYSQVAGNHIVFNKRMGYNSVARHINAKPSINIAAQIEIENEIKLN